MSSCRFPNRLPARRRRLYFDLIGFGDDASSVQVSNIELDALTVSWQNPINRFDVTDSDGINATDALVIINELANQTVHDPATSELFEITDTVGPPPFYDVNGDGKITAVDALQVINAMERGTGEIDLSWQNPVDRFDVNDDDGVSAVDALMIVNELRNAKVYNPASGQLPAVTDDVGPAPFYDVSGDGKLSAVDAIQVINEIARRDKAEPELFDLALLDLEEND